MTDRDLALIGFILLFGSGIAGLVLSLLGISIPAVGFPAFYGLGMLSVLIRRRSRTPD